MRRINILFFSLCCSVLSSYAQKFQQEFGNPRKAFVETVAIPDHAGSNYRLGEPATLRVVAREGGVPLDGAILRYKVAPEMFLPVAYDSIQFVNGEATISLGTMTEPGFLACQYEFTAADGKKYGDLVKLAFSPESIKSFTPMPQDFSQFWKAALKEARKVDLQPEYFDVPSATNDQFVTRLVRLHVGKNKWMQGYLTMPRDGKQYPVVLCPPGAGSTKIYPSDYFPKENCIYLKIEIHDNDQRLPDDEYNEMRRKKCDGYMRRGMASKDTYYYKDVYVGCARAVDFLCSLPEWDGKNVIVTGGSQGGALTIVTAALNEKVTLCAPFYPALCDLTGFLHQRAGGWPKFFSSYYKDSQVDVPQTQAEETLQYFDVVNFARQLKVPTFMSWGYNDDTCSPTSVWSAWNEIQAPKEKDITPSSGHWRFPSSQQKCLEWMKRNMKDIVILTAGQSNADGRVPLTDLPEELKEYSYCQWSYGSGDFETATGKFSPFSPRVAKPKIENSWGFDAVVYKKLEQLFQRPFYVIKHTDGGTAIDPSCKSSTHGLYWSADTAFLNHTTSASHGGKSLLKAFERQIDDCLPNLPKNYDIKCLIWHQGESDQQAADRYYDNLKAVIHHVREHLVQVTGKEAYRELPVICGTFSKYSRQGSPVVAEALYRLAREDKHFYVVDASDLPLLRDRLHFNAQGAQTLGQRVFDCMKKQKIVE